MTNRVEKDKQTTLFVIVTYRGLVYMNKFAKKILVIVGAIVTFLVLMYGYVAGFYPFEHNIIIRNAKRYVIETYGLTPTDVEVTTLYLWFPVMVRVETEEDDFWFQLRTSRFHYSVIHFGDNYLERMTAHILASELRSYVEEVTNGQGGVWASVTSGRTGILDQFSLSELKDNPSIAVEKLQGQYHIRVILYDDISLNGYNINYDLVFDIFYHTFKIGLEPSWISFSFVNDDNSNFEILLRVTIDRRDFPYINVPDDLKPLFEEAIRSRLK